MAYDDVKIYLSSIIAALLRSFMAAWAAASLAIGTRKGEQLT
jgi:hypothetical protein